MRIARFSLVLTIALAACGPDYLYDERVELPGETWTYADSVTFEFPIRDTQQRYNLYLTLDHTTGYPFQNLYTRIHTRFPSGDNLTQQVSLELADKSGRWLGDCSGENCRLRIPLQTDTYFNQPGVYAVTFEQFMRRDSLPGIQNLAFSIEHVKK